LVSLLFKLKLYKVLQYLGCLVFFLSSSYYLELSEIGLTKFGWIKLELWILQALPAFKWIRFKRFYEKPVYTETPELSLNYFFKPYPYGTIH
jgi:hypothetical protein